MTSISVGITGNIASGKTTVLNLIAETGYSIFSADMYIKELYKNRDIQQQILDMCHIPSFSMSAVAQAMYFESDIRQKVQNFIHPFVREGLVIFQQQHSEKDLVFSEIPLLFEVNFLRYFDLVATVFCSDKSRLTRAQTRSGFDQKIYDIITNIQWTQIQKMTKSDFVINTDVEIVSLQQQIEALIKKCRYYVKTRNNIGY